MLGKQTIFVNEWVIFQIAAVLATSKMIGEPNEDGEETKSDFLARMILMGRIEIDEKNK